MASTSRTADTENYNEDSSSNSTNTAINPTMLMRGGTHTVLHTRSGKRQAKTHTNPLLCLPHTKVAANTSVVFEPVSTSLYDCVASSARTPSSLVTAAIARGVHVNESTWACGTMRRRVTAVHSQPNAVDNLSHGRTQDSGSPTPNQRYHTWVVKRRATGPNSTRAS